MYDTHMYSILTIHQMLFTGYNMLSHSDNNSMHSVCQYGGLFLIDLKYTGPQEDFSICSNITKESLVPHEVGKIGAFIFITFQGYSNGFIDLTVHDEDNYFGDNIVISRGPSCNNVQRSYYDIYFSGTGNGSDKTAAACTDVWLLNNIFRVETSPVETCSFALDHSRLAFPSGPFKMIVSTLFNIPSRSSSIFTDISVSAYINVEMDVFKKSPIHTTTEKVNFSVPLLNTTYRQLQFICAHSVPH